MGILCFLKLLAPHADDVDMEPADQEPLSAAWPSPSTEARPIVATPASGTPEIGSRPKSDGDMSYALTDVSAPQTSLPMFAWRVLTAVAAMVALGLTAWQAQRVIDDQPRSGALLFWSVVAGLVAGGAVLAWTWSTTSNALRLLAPSSARDLPSPRHALSTWIPLFVFIGASAVVLGYIARQSDISADEVSALPPAVAVLALLGAIPLTYRPLKYMASVVRQVGGYSTNLAQWMWVPVVLAAVGVASIELLKAGGAFEDLNGGWAPLWAVAVVAIAPCLITLLLAWRAAGLVEEAIGLAFARRDGIAPSAAPTPSKSKRRGSSSSAAAGKSGVAHRSRTRQVPGPNLLRLSIVTLLAGLALLSVVGAAVMFLFWRESNGGVLLPSQVDRAWDTIEVLHEAERIAAFVLIGLVSLWAFVTVLNARLASGRRRNPLLAALAWPAAFVGVWAIADGLIVDQSTGRVVAGFIAQAAVLYLPFFFLERAAEVVGARRTPLRITYVFGVVLLVYIQGLAGLATISQGDEAAEYGKLAGYLALGALVQLLSTLSVTEASRVISEASKREAELNTLLAEQSRPSDGTVEVDPSALVAPPVVPESVDI